MHLRSVGGANGRLLRVRVHQPRGRGAARRQGAVQQEDRRENAVRRRPRQDDARKDRSRTLCLQVIFSRQTRGLEAAGPLANGVFYALHRFIPLALVTWP